MQDEGYLVHFPESRTYGLSTLVTEVGTAAMRAERLELLARPLLTRLVKRTGLPVVGHVGVLQGTGIVYVIKESAPRAPTLVTDIGVHLPAHLTATGRAILSQFAHKQILALYPHNEDLFHRTGAGPNTLRELESLLEESRRRGWAVEHNEITDEYASVAAAAVDHNQYPAAAIGLTFRVPTIGTDMWGELGHAVTSTANALTMRLQSR